MEALFLRDLLVKSGNLHTHIKPILEGTIYESPFIDDNSALKIFINKYAINVDVNVVINDDIDVLPRYTAYLFIRIYINRLFSPNIRKKLNEYKGQHAQYAENMMGRLCERSPTIKHSNWFYVSPYNTRYFYVSVAVRAYLDISKEYFHKIRLLIRSKAGLCIGFDEHLLVEIYKMMVPQYPLIKHFIGHMLSLYAPPTMP